jgi:prepilin-type N-terminal cleavage/methylation domain-containing protein
MNKLKQKGFSIVELIIAMAISLLLVFACTSVYSSLSASIDTSQRLSNAQESLRGAHYLLARSIRQGYGLSVSGAVENQRIIVTYGTEADDNFFYGCLGKRQESGAIDTFYVSENINKKKHLYCETRASAGAPTTNNIIALDVTYISASLATGTKKGIDINLKIDGMPSGAIGTMGVDGFTFSLAMRQRILIDSYVVGASSMSLGTGL